MEKEGQMTSRKDLENLVKEEEEIEGKMRGQEGFRGFGKRRTEDRQEGFREFGKRRTEDRQE